MGPRKPPPRPRPRQPRDLLSKSCRPPRGRGGGVSDGGGQVLSSVSAAEQRLRATPQRPSCPSPACGSHAHHARNNKARPSGPQGPSCHPSGGRQALGRRLPRSPGGGRHPTRPPSSLPAGKLPAPLGLSRPPASGARKRPHIAGGRAGEPGARGPRSPRLLGGNLSGAWAAAARTRPEPGADSTAGSATAPKHGGCHGPAGCAEAPGPGKRAAPR